MPEIVTISVNKMTNDRSFSHGYYQVVARNELNTRVLALKDDFWGKVTDTKDILLNTHEHDFAHAKPLLSQDEFTSLLVKCIFV